MTKKQQRSNEQISLSAWIIGGMLILLAILAWIVVVPSIYERADKAENNPTTSEDVRALILEANDAAKNGTVQEAYDAYTAAADAAKEIGDDEAWATADANASTFQAILDSRVQRETLDAEAYTGGGGAELE